MEEKIKSGSSIGGVVFIGCMFVGIGFGFIYNAVHIGAVIGMGVGFISMGTVWAYYRNK